jgi:diacylglycerol kinase family enzyme
VTSLLDRGPPAKVLVLMNRAAGSVQHADESSAAVKAAFDRHGLEANIKRVPGPEIADAAQEFVARRTQGNGHGDEAFVIAGGDGSISTAAGVFAGTDIPLGILPMGTLNHFAKDLGLPLELEAAAGVVAAGHTRTVDVAELNGRVFVNNSSVGLYPFMVARRNAHQRQRGLSKLLATFPALVETLSRTSLHRLDIAATGERQRIRTPCIFVGNNPYEVSLAAFGKRKRLDSGELDIHVVRQRSRLGVLLLPFKVALGIADRDRDVQSFRSIELEIDSLRRRSLRVSLDGEVVHVETPLRYRSRPQALRVYSGA